MAAYAALGLLVFAVGTVNALSQLHDLRSLGERVATWEAFAQEYCSCAVILAILPLVSALTKVAPPGRRHWLSFGLVHALATIPYSLVHIGGFVLLRTVVYAALGQSYHFASSTALLYEYRKDVLSYALFVAFFAIVPRPFVEREDARSPTPPATFDIRDGARVLRARVCDIVMAKAAGNYVEFHLSDGRRTLMRTPLARVECTLTQHGFVRTHRSWLVNSAHVRELVAENRAGDFRIRLDGGVTAPLSRRFPEALAQLRRST
jgi:hypothetical protein